MNGKNKNELVELVRLVVAEAREREACLTDGTKVAFGSDEHIKELESRIEELTSWRQRKPRGSEARATYSRLITHLKRELSAARRASLQTSNQSNDSSSNLERKL